MEALGLDVPTSWYGTQVTILTKLGAVVAAVDKLGKGATLAELVGATTLPEKLLVGGAVYASFYTGAAIGSAMVATGKYMGCGASSANNGRAVLRFQADTGIRVSPRFHHHLQCHPEIFDQSAPGRRAYAYAALVCDSSVSATAVTDRRNGAGEDRRKGATWKGSETRFRTPSRMLVFGPFFNA
ncbi:hypothetical protein [Trinickia dabaoshanensis]|uniref:hypothetical protein n=1 Tax=Trinickia dabaoshanensis TaxID=564714 RepID=UPI001E5BEE18|nr:hypothetical protein [Trinickia dabaoshanensis]